MPTKQKCIAFIGDIKCKNPVRDEDLLREWPYSVLCESHAQNLDEKTSYKNGHGVFKTQYKSNKTGKVKELHLCTDNNRDNIRGKVFFCTKEESENPYQKDFEYDDCTAEVNNAGAKLSGGLGGLSSTPRSPRASVGTPTYVAPGSPRAGIQTAIKSHAPASISDIDIRNNMNQSICKNKDGGGNPITGIPIGIIDNPLNRNIGKVDDEVDMPIYVSYGSGDADSEGVGRRYLPPLYADVTINKDLPPYFKKKLLVNVRSSLKNIDETRNASTALQQVKLVMTAIESDKDAIYNAADYTVNENVINLAAKELGMYMYDERRIELVITFLFDYATRDMFNPMRYYGFSTEDPLKSSYKSLLDTIPYYLLNPSSGKICAEIAKPHPISPAFKEILDRIGLNIKSSPAVSGASKPCDIKIDNDKQGSEVKEIFTAILDNKGIEGYSLDGIDDGKTYKKDKIIQAKTNICGSGFKKENLDTIIKTLNATNLPSPVDASKGARPPSSPVPSTGNTYKKDSFQAGLINKNIKINNNAIDQNTFTDNTVAAAQTKDSSGKTTGKIYKNAANIAGNLNNIADGTNYSTIQDFADDLVGKFKFLA